MATTAENNKRIAKNTLLLYFRMLLMIVINLYTSRVILQVLGVEDFGINNVVGGVITMLGFLTSSLAAASSRYITYDLGKGDIATMKKTFGNILSIHLLLAVIIIIIGETIGLWFMTTQLQIPESRETAAFWVYQFSIVSFVLSVISVPYNASIIAHEKMSAFAYISIADAILKLVIVYLLLVIPYDKLIVYAALFCCIQVFDRIIYSVYCRKHFEETRSGLNFDKYAFTFGEVTIGYGKFITAVINFLIMALIVFCIVKAMNRATSKLKKEEAVQEAATTKVCPYCKSEISLEATRCPHCTSQLEA